MRQSSAYKPYSVAHKREVWKGLLMRDKVIKTCGGCNRSFPCDSLFARALRFCGECGCALRSEPLVATKTELNKAEMSMNLEKEEVSTGADYTSLIECVFAFLNRWYASIVER